MIHKSPIRCFACLNQLEIISYRKNKLAPPLYYQLECPQVHCQLWLGPSPENQVEKYIIWIDRQDKRYRITAQRDKYTELLQRVDGWHPSTGWTNFKELLFVPHYKELIIENNVVQGEQLFEKMRTLLLFS